MKALVGGYSLICDCGTIQRFPTNTSPGLDYSKMTSNDIEFAVSSSEGRKAKKLGFEKMIDEVSVLVRNAGSEADRVRYTDFLNKTATTLYNKYK